MGAEKPGRSSFLLALAVGLCAAFLLGGGGLTYAGYQSLDHPVDCAGLGSDECETEQNIVNGWTRYQLGFGAGLLFLGTGLGATLWFTERRRRAAKE